MARATLKLPKLQLEAKLPGLPQVPADPTIKPNTYYLTVTNIMDLVRRGAFFPENPEFEPIKQFTMEGLHSFASKGLISIEGQPSKKPKVCSSCSKKRIYAFFRRVAANFQKLMLYTIDKSGESTILKDLRVFMERHGIITFDTKITGLFFTLEGQRREVTF